MRAEPMSLAQLVGPSGFLISDIAFLAGIEESTVSRLWDDPEWLDRVKGRTLRSIVSVVPGVAEYLAGFSLADRRRRLTENLDNTELELDESAFRQLIRTRCVPEQYLNNALDAAVTILSGDARHAASFLFRFWGRDQDVALTFLFGKPETYHLLVDTEPLVAASIDLADRLIDQKNSFHATIAYATLMHHVARVEPDFVDDRLTPDKNRQSIFAFRSTMIGRIISTDNFDLAERYHRETSSSPLLPLVEAWAFPTYTRDAKATSDFSLPRSLLLRHTAKEIIREVDQYNESYFYYVVSTAIPTLLQYDTTFGLQLPQLTTALYTRLERCEHVKTRRACYEILRSLNRNFEYTEEAPFDSWRSGQLRR